MPEQPTPLHLEGDVFNHATVQDALATHAAAKSFLKERFDNPFEPLVVSEDLFPSQQVVAPTESTPNSEAASVNPPKEQQSSSSIVTVQRRRSGGVTHGGILGLVAKELKVVLGDILDPANFPNVTALEHEGRKYGSADEVRNEAGNLVGLNFIQQAGPTYIIRKTDLSELQLAAMDKAVKRARQNLAENASSPQNFRTVFSRDAKKVTVTPLDAKGKLLRKNSVHAEVSDQAQLPKAA